MKVKKVQIDTTKREKDAHMLPTIYLFLSLPPFPHTYLALPFACGQIQPLPRAVMKGNNPHRQRNEPKQDLRRNVGDDARKTKVLELLTERTRVFIVGFVAQADK